MTRRLAIVFVAMCLGQAALAVPEKLPDPAQETRAVELQKQLRCLVCQGESLDESNAPLAADLRHLIRERIAAADSDAAVKRYLVARYGDFILMKPPVSTDTYVLWFAPFALILMGGAVVAVIVLRAHERLKTAELGAPDHSTANSEEKA
jgi:cytochrome c-type biogenesis protein CcmH